MSDTSSHNHPEPESKPKLSGTHSSRAVCDLCGLSLRHGRVSATFYGKTYHFCCTGCRQVFNILLEASEGNNPETFRQSELFKQCREKGIIPKSEAELAHNQPAGASKISSDTEPAAPVADSPPDPQAENVLDLEQSARYAPFPQSAESQIELSQSAWCNLRHVFASARSCPAGGAG